MRAFKIMIILCVGLLSGIPSVQAAGQAAKKPLDQVFDRMVIIPYDYHGKAFINGRKTDVSGDYRLVQRNGRVLVPIRLMSYLATQLDGYRDVWEAIWQPGKPNDVILQNTGLHKTVKFTVNRKTMTVNGKSETLDVAPQIVDGRIVLPLRSAAEALDKKIDWLDGLILLGDDYADLQDPQTLAVKDRIKQQLADTRSRVPGADQPAPIAKSRDTVYYLGTDGDGKMQLYKQTAGGPETPVGLPGTPELGHAPIVNGEYYFITTLNGHSELDAFRFADGRSRKICPLDDWTPGDGWLADVRYIDNDLYVNLHDGDLTMGGETLLKVDQGVPTTVANAKSFIGYAKSGDKLYAMDFRFMSQMPDNLIQIDLPTGKRTAIGQPDYTYGVVRTFDDRSGGTEYAMNKSLYVQDGFVYALGYKEDDRTDKSAVYKVNLSDHTQSKLTPAAKAFWLADDRISYIDEGTGSLNSVDRNGGDSRVEVARKVSNVQFADGVFTYTANAFEPDSGQGELYQYAVAAGREKRLGDRATSRYFVGPAGIYYVSDGYEPGLYKVDAGGQNTRLVKDNIESAVLADDGIVYTLTYREGIFFAR